MLEDFQFDEVVAGACVGRPHVILPETDPVEDSFRQAIETISAFLRIAKSSADPLNNTGFAPDIDRCAAVSRGLVKLDYDPVTDFEFAARR